MRSASLLATLRALDRHLPTWTHDTGWSALDPFSVERYGNVPVEAFPFLDSHADGGHYALFVDEASADVPPPIVWVSPMDGTPETLQRVAVDVERFAALVRHDGLWRRPSAEAERAATEVAHNRAKQVARRTKDGMGVVLTRAEPALPRPADEVIASWRADRSELFAHAVRGWLEAGAPGLALAVARDLIADHDALATVGFADQLGAIYDALGRPHLAMVARAAYR